MRVLIIGGTKFIGPFVVRRLIEAGHGVMVFHRGETKSDLPLQVSRVHADRRDIRSFRAEFERFRPEIVLDMVAYTAEDARALAETVRGIAQRIVTLSSGDVYQVYERLLRLSPGPPEPVPLSEDAPLRQVLFPYRSKAKGPEDLLYHYDKIPVEQVVIENRDTPGTILRLPCVYGPNDYQHRLSDYLRRMDDGRPAILLEETKAQWRWSRGYVENVAAAIALAVTNDTAAGHIYNVADEPTLSEVDWVRAIGQAAGWSGKIVTAPASLMPASMVDDLDWSHDLVYDTTRISQELGYTRKIQLDEALKEAITWERANPPHHPEKLDKRKVEYAAEDEVLSKLSESGL